MMKVSAPAPPVSMSSPAFPFRVSAPFPPMRVSARNEPVSFTALLLLLFERVKPFAPEVIADKLTDRPLTVMLAFPLLKLVFMGVQALVRLALNEPEII
jgi:hypothetical protein